MLLGVSPLAIRPAPLVFKPWLSSRCLAWFDAEAPGQSVDGSNYVSSAPSRQDASKTLTALTTKRPLLNATGILGRPAWGHQGVTTSFQCSPLVLPASPYFVYGIASLDSGSQSFGSIYSGNNAFLPLLQSNGGGSNQVAIHAGGNYLVAITYSVPKRYVVSCQGSTSDKLQWGGTTTTGTGLGSQDPHTGVALFSYFGDSTNTHMQGYQAVWGLFSGDPATGNLQAAIDGYVATRGYTSSGAALFT